MGVALIIIVDFAIRAQLLAKTVESGVFLKSYIQTTRGHGYKFQGKSRHVLAVITMLILHGLMNAISAHRS